MDTKTCLQCGTELRGRIDKKFCDDQCRTAYNNSIKTDSAIIKNINSTLRKNRKLMEDLTPMPEGKTKVARKKLEEKGFNFTYHTHTYTTKTGATYYFCYEYGYLPLEKDYFMLVKRKEENT
jgi:hypothetical protein